MSDPTRTKNLLLDTRSQLRRLCVTNDPDQVRLILLEHLELEVEELENQYIMETGHALDTGGIQVETQSEAITIPSSESSPDSERPVE